MIHVWAVLSLHDPLSGLASALYKQWPPVHSPALTRGGVALQSYSSHFEVGTVSGLCLSNTSEWPRTHGFPGGRCSQGCL